MGNSKSRAKVTPENGNQHRNAKALPELSLPQPEPPEKQEELPPERGARWRRGKTLAAHKLPVQNPETITPTSTPYSTESYAIQNGSETTSGLTLTEDDLSRLQLDPPENRKETPAERASRWRRTKALLGHSYVPNDSDAATALTELSLLQLRPPEDQQEQRPAERVSRWKRLKSPGVGKHSVENEPTTTTSAPYSNGSGATTALTELSIIQLHPPQDQKEQRPSRWQRLKTLAGRKPASSATTASVPLSNESNATTALTGLSVLQLHPPEKQKELPERGSGRKRVKPTAVAKPQEVAKPRAVAKAPIRPKSKSTPTITSPVRFPAFPMRGTAVSLIKKLTTQEPSYTNTADTANSMTPPTNDEEDMPEVFKWSSGDTVDSITSAGISSILKVGRGRNTNASKQHFQFSGDSESVVNWSLLKNSGVKTNTTTTSEELSSRRKSKSPTTTPTSGNPRTSTFSPIMPMPGPASKKRSVRVPTETDNKGKIKVFRLNAKPHFVRTLS